jgi:hypothetical protein
MMLAIVVYPMFTYRNYVKYEVAMDGRQLEFLPAFFRIRIRIIHVDYKFYIQHIQYIVTYLRLCV